MIKRIILSALALLGAISLQAMSQQDNHVIELTIEGQQYTASLKNVLDHIMHYRMHKDENNNAKIVGFHCYTAQATQPCMSGTLTKINPHIWVFTYGNTAEFHKGYVIHNGCAYTAPKTFFPCSYDRAAIAAYIKQLNTHEYTVTATKTVKGKQEYHLAFKATESGKAHLRLIAHLRPQVQHALSIPTIYPIIGQQLIGQQQTSVQETVNSTLEILAKQQQLLLQALQVNSAPLPAENKTSLMSAAKAGDIDTITQLLDSGVNASAVDAQQRSALWYAFDSGDFYTLMCLMPTQAAALNRRDQTGTTPLIYALTHKPAIISLVNFLEIIEFLLASGANPNQADAQGLTPLMHTVRLCFENSENYLLAKALIPLLFDFEAAIDTRHTSGNTALMMAVEYNLRDMVETLLNVHADCALTNSRGQTALLLAQRQRLTGIEQLLQQAMSHKAHWLQEHQATELHYAAYTKNRAKVHAILANQQQLLEVTDNNGATPLYTALEVADNDAVISCLLSAGADPSKHVYHKTIAAYAQESNSLSADIKQEIQQTYERITKPLLEQQVKAKEEQQQKLRALAAQFKKELSAGHITKETLQAIEPIKNLCFIEAVTQSNIPVVKQLLECTINLLTRNKDKQDAIDRACAQHNQHMLELLIATPLMPDVRIQALWDTAIDNQQCAIIDSISSLRRPLRMANIDKYIKEQRSNILRLLLNKERVPLTSQEASRAVHAALEYSTLEIVDLLASLYPQALSCTTSTGQTALMLAALQDKPQLVRYVYNHCAGDRVQEGTHILECSTLPKKSRELLLTLIKQDNEQQQAQAQQIVKQQEIVQLQAQGYTPLMIAAYFDNVLEVQKHREDSAAIINTGQTALMIAACRKSNQVFDSLLEASKEVLNMQDSNGYTPLMHAVCAGNSYAAGKLIHAGADKALTTHDHKTALDLVKLQDSNSLTHELEYLLTTAQDKQPKVQKNRKQKKTLPQTVTDKPKRISRLTLPKEKQAEFNGYFKNVPPILDNYKQVPSKQVKEDDITNVILSQFGSLPESMVKEYIRRAHYLQNKGALIDDGPFVKRFSIKELYEAGLITEQDINKGNNGMLDLSDKYISNLDGLDILIKTWDFSNLFGINLSKNELGALSDREIIMLAALPHLTVLIAKDNDIDYIADTIGLLNNLQYINLSGNPLSELPDTLGQLTNLKQLIIHTSDLEKVPTTIGNLTNLTTLVLDDNDLKELPQQICQLKQLKELSISKNGLTALPKGMEKLKRLQFLALQGNKLTALPDQLALLPALSVLDISYNNFKQVPTCIAGMRNVSRLAMAGLSLTEVPESIGLLPNLKELSLDNNRLKEIPASIGQLKQLELLQLNDNQLTTLPQTIGNLAQLKLLIINNNCFTSLPNSLHKLHSLQILEAVDNKLTSLPIGVCKLPALRELKISNNNIKVLPDAIGALTTLTDLHIGDNQLTTLPDSIAALQNLRKLLLYCNKFTQLPLVLCSLTNLERLFVDGNFLTTLPEQLGNLVNLIVVNAKGNQLSQLPTRIGQLINLTELYLDNNQLTTVPNTLLLLPKLTSITYGNNPLTQQAVELIKRALVLNNLKAHKIEVTELIPNTQT